MKCDNVVIWACARIDSTRSHLVLHTALDQYRNVQVCEGEDVKKRLDTLIVSLKESFEKVLFLKVSGQQQKYENLPSMQRVKCLCFLV